MNGLFKYISPFTPDQSGATSVLFSLGGIVVICDAGGCAGNICGFDEPRWFTEKSAVFSAGLRDIDAILGRDERLVQKLEEAISFIDAKFVAIIGTPVPAVIGTDFRALRRMAERRLNTTVLALDTTGIGLYDEGEEKAYISLLSAFAQDKFCRSFDVGVFGATPLNMPYKGYEKKLKAQLERKYGKISLFIGDEGIEDFKNAGGAKLNIAISTSGIKACEYLKQRFGTEYIVEFPTETENTITNFIKSTGNRTLIIHQQVLANSLRKMLEANGNTADVATWFKLNKNYSQAKDIRLTEEDGFFSLLEERKYDCIIADPIFKRCLSDFEGKFIPLCHYACSGELFADEAEQDWQNYFGKQEGAEN